jgi:hypothetical protein
MEFKYVKIAVFVPSSHADKIRKVLAVNDAGHIGNYDCCSFSSKGVGRFRGDEGTKPFVGKSGSIEQVEEEKIETICERGKVHLVVEEIKKAHPYEEPAIDVYPLLNEY